MQACNDLEESLEEAPRLVAHAEDLNVAQVLALDIAPVDKKFFYT
jgi:hypothetical protein